MYYVYDQGSGEVVEFDTLDQSVNYMEDSIDYYRNEASYDGEWSDSVKDITTIWTDKSFNIEDDEEFDDLLDLFYSKQNIVAMVIETRKEYILDDNDNPTSDYSCDYEVAIVKNSLNET